MRVIGLSGWKGSGKDTVAEYLVEKHGYIQLSFARRLKDMVSKAYGIERSWLDDPERKELPLAKYPAISTDATTDILHTLLRGELRDGYWTPRAILILEGSLKRAIYPNYWVQSVAQEILDNPSWKYVISDVRYKSELDTLKVLLPQFRSVRVERHIEVASIDASERDLDNYKFDHVLTNRGTKEKLYENIDSLLSNPVDLPGSGLLRLV